MIVASSLGEWFMSFVLSVTVSWENENGNYAFIIVSVVIKSLWGRSFSLTWGRKTKMKLIARLFRISVNAPAPRCLRFS